MTDETMVSKGFGRRQLLTAAALAPLLALPGCAGGLGGFSLLEAIQRLLSISSQRAFATLLQPGGFYDNQAARIPLPARIADDRSLVTRVLTSGPVRDQLSRSLNRAAERGAERAAPIVTDSIRNLNVGDALSVVRGGGRAATSLLEGQVGTALVSAMFPAVGDALRVAADPIVGQVLGRVTGYDIAGLARDVSDGANRAIWNGIGVEEEAIRRNPSATNDPLIMGVFGLAGRGA
jgi:hypothetical protein